MDPTLPDFNVVPTSECCPTLHLAANGESLSTDQLVALRAEVEALHAVSVSNYSRAVQEKNRVAHWLSSDGPARWTTRGQSSAIPASSLPQALPMYAPGVRLGSKGRPLGRPRKRPLEGVQMLIPPPLPPTAKKQQETRVSKRAKTTARTRKDDNDDDDDKYQAPLPISQLPSLAGPLHEFWVSIDALPPPPTTTTTTTTTTTAATTHPNSTSTAPSTALPTLDQVDSLDEPLDAWLEVPALPARGQPAYRQARLTLDLAEAAAECAKAGLLDPSLADTEHHSFDAVYARLHAALPSISASTPAQQARVFKASSEPMRRVLAAAASTDPSKDVFASLARKCGQTLRYPPADDQILDQLRTAQSQLAALRHSRTELLREAIRALPDTEPTPPPPMTAPSASPSPQEPQPNPDILDSALFAADCDVERCYLRYLQRRRQGRPLGKRLEADIERAIESRKRILEPRPSKTKTK